MARSACHRASTTRRGATPRPRSWRRSRRRPARTAASTTPTSATRSATASSTRSGRRSRSADGPRRRPTSPTSITARRTRAAPTGSSTSSTTPAPRASTSRSMPIRTNGRAPACSSSCRIGSRRAARSAQGASRRRPTSASGSEREIQGRGLLRRCGPAGRTSASATSSGRAAALGGPARSATHGRDGQRRRRHALRPVARRGPGPQRGHARPVVETSGSFVRTRSGWSARIRRSSAQSPARGRTARSRGSSANSSATRRCSASRRRSAR